MGAHRKNFLRKSHHNAAAEGLFCHSRFLPFAFFLGCALLVLNPTEIFAYEDNINKSKSLASYTMGVVYDLQGLSAKAVEEFEKSAGYDDNYAVHLRLGANYARMGKLDEAIVELKKVLKFDEHNVQARYLLALVYTTKKDFDSAAKEYESILTSFSDTEPQNVEIYGYLGQLYYSQKKYQEAIKQFEILLKFEPESPDVTFLVGALYFEIGQKQKAVEYFSRTLSLDPENDGALNSLGYAYAEEGVKLDEAATLVAHALQIDPENGAYLDSMGWVYFKQGKNDEALKYFQLADQQLKDPVIYEHIGDVYFNMNKKEDAKKYWTLSLQLQSNHEVEKKLDSLK